jgi:hypothetical protein
LAGVAQERKFFRVVGLDPSVGAGVFTEKATGALFFIDSKIAIPGKGAFRAGIDTRLRFTGKTDKDLLFIRPVGLNANSRLFGRDGAIMGKRTDDLTDSASRAQRGKSFHHILQLPLALPLSPRGRGMR